MRRRKAGFILLFLGLVSLAGSVWLLANNRRIENTAYQKAMLTAQALYEEIQSTKAKSARADYEPLSFGNTVPLVEINGEYYLGMLSIPSLSLKLPINNDYDDDKLEISPCRYAGDISGALVICAHNFDNQFDDIHTLSYGDTITITDATGYGHNYTVALVTTLHDSEVDAMIDTSYALTLFTCTKIRTERVTVRCVKTDAAEEKSLVNRPETPLMADDPDAAEAPSFQIDYTRETIKLRNGYLYSMNGITFEEVSEKAGVMIDVSDCITSNTPIYIKKDATRILPMSKTQMIMPLTRAKLENQTFVPVNGKLILGSEYEVYNPYTMRWGALPRITANAALDIRLKKTARYAASLPALLMITYGEYEPGKKGVIGAEIVMRQRR